MYGKRNQAGAQKKGQGAMPLAGCRGGAPAGVWGNAPTVPRQTNSKGTAHKGAGSEASLPLTSRVLRRAPKPLYPTTVLCRAKWARPSCWSCDHSRSFPNAGDFAPAGATRGLCGRPLDPFAFSFGCYWLVMFILLFWQAKSTQTITTFDKNQETWARTEGFQRATGKPFGRRRSGEIFRTCTPDWFRSSPPANRASAAAQ